MSDSSPQKLPANADSPMPSAHNLLQVSDIDNIWLLPDGVSDLLSEQAQKQEWLRYTLTQLLVRRGYELTGPPMIEFTESLLGNASEDLKRQTFKIIDQLSGRLMGVRADITPQISRIDAHLQKIGQADKVARYCYAGHVIRTLPNGLFGSRTPLQFGAEIFGFEGLAADLELIDVLYSIFDTLGLKQQLHIGIGHVGIFNRLKQLSAISNQDSDLLIRLYANKALPDLKSISQRLPMGADFYHLAVYGHDMAALKQALSDTAKQDDIITTAIDDVLQISNHITHQYQGNISVDITELGYHYHTGIVFDGYFENDSQPIVSGGRFNAKPMNADNINHNINDLEAIQSDGSNIRVRSATGFSLELSRLQRRIDLPTVKKVLVSYDDLMSVNSKTDDQTDSKHSAIRLPKALSAMIDDIRDSGNQVIVPLSAEDAANGVTHRLVLIDDSWTLQAVNNH